MIGSIGLSTISKLAAAGCISAVLVILATPQRAPADDCCQCPLPACGIPRNGSCGGQCVLVRIPSVMGSLANANRSAPRIRSGSPRTRITMFKDAPCQVKEPVVRER